MTPAFLDVAGIQFGYIKSSKVAMEILANYRSPYFCNSIKTLDRSTLCTAIPNTQLQSRLKELIQRCISQ
jgi:hypothetical protein